jgi:hypothetical protein
MTTRPPFWPKLNPETTSVRPLMLTLPALEVTYPGADVVLEGALHPSGTAMLTLAFWIRTVAL